MIIFKRGSVPPRATRLDFEFAAPPAPTPPGDPDPELARRHDALDRTQRHAALVELEARGAQLLDEMERDGREDPFTLEKDAADAFDAMTAERFSPIADPAMHATMMRKAAPARSRFSARARAMQVGKENLAVADMVMNAAQAVFETAARDPERVELLEPLSGAIDASLLPPDHKDMLKTGLAARAVKLGFDDNLGPLFAKFREPGRQLLSQTERAERQAAPPDVVLASAEATAGLRQTDQQPTEQTVRPASNISPLTEPRAPREPEGPFAAPDRSSQSVLGDVFPEGVPRAVRQSLQPLIDSERGELEEAIVRLRALAAPDNVVRRVVEDIADAVPDAVRQQRQTATPALVIPLIAVTVLVIASLEVQRRRGSAEGAAMETTEFFNRLIDDMRRLLQDESGEEGNEDTGSAAKGGDDRDLSRDDNNPPEVLDDADTEDLDPDPEDDDDDGAFEGERPNLGKPGSHRNPDGTPKSADEQFEQVHKAQSRNRTAIESIKKSKQNDKNALNEWKRR